MQIEVSADEVQLLKKLAEQALGDIKAEVRHTETREYRDKLHAEEDLLVGLVKRFSEAG